MYLKLSNERARSNASMLVGMMSIWILEVVIDLMLLTRYVSQLSSPASDPLLNAAISIAVYLYYRKRGTGVQSRKLHDDWDGWSLMWTAMWDMSECSPNDTSRSRPLNV